VKNIHYGLYCHFHYTRDSLALMKHPNNVLYKNSVFWRNADSDYENNSFNCIQSWQYWASISM